jgi:hypothetical protein
VIRCGRGRWPRPMGAFCHKFAAVGDTRLQGSLRSPLALKRNRDYEKTCEQQVP